MVNPEHMPALLARLMMQASETLHYPALHTYSPGGCRCLPLLCWACCLDTCGYSCLCC